MTAAPHALLHQNNRLPGNRGGRFRFDHLLVIAVLTPIYLWFELSFGVTLLDSISAQVIAEDTAAIEHWGRIISGCAVGLLGLSVWLDHCEKHDLAWPTRIGVALLQFLAAIALTWWVQGAVIDFYVKRSQTEITAGVRSLVLLLVLGAILLRHQLRRAVRHDWRWVAKHAIGWTLIIALGHAYLSWVLKPGADEIAALGRERQRAADLTVVRRALEEGVHALPGVDAAGDLYRSPEGKTFLALFPILAAGADPAALRSSRDHLVFELAYAEWRKTYGEQSLAAYQEAQNELFTVFDSVYLNQSDQWRKDRRQFGEAQALARWKQAMAPHFGAEPPAPGLGWLRFVELPAVGRYLRQQLGCFDCDFRFGMNPNDFGRELFTWTQAHNVRQTLERLDDPHYFESGRDGERAARTFWVPIWALLFSMLGAFTHLFKMMFTLTEYAHLRSFHRIGAADSPLARRVVATSRLATATVVAGLVLVIYFAENRVTGHERYAAARPNVWAHYPIAGALAAHWTINAQAIIYPITRKVRPNWLRFETDPLALLPFSDNS